MNNRLVTFITFFPPLNGKRPAKEVIEAFGEQLGPRFRGLILMPGGKSTATLRKHMRELAAERGFGVFAAECEDGDQVAVTNALAASRGIYVSREDEGHPALGYAKYQGDRLRVTRY